MLCTHGSAHPLTGNDLSRDAMTAFRHTLYRDAVLADGTRPSLRKGGSVLVDDRLVVRMRLARVRGAAIRRNR